MSTMKEKNKPGPAGEDELIHRLFVEEYAAMRAAALAALGDSGLAESAVQETFVAALRFREKLAASENPVGWLYRALRYTIQHIRRERQLLLLRTVPLDTLSESESAQCDHYDLLEEEIRSSEEMKLLEAFYLQGYSIRELALREGISEGAIKMRLKRAREKLRKKLQ